MSFPFVFILVPIIRQNKIASAEMQISDKAASSAGAASPGAFGSSNELGLHFFNVLGSAVVEDLDHVIYRTVACIIGRYIFGNKSR